MLEISLAGAFLGGVLAIFSPCSALLLPSFFAYAFQSRRELAGRTAIFFLGVCTLMIPLGMGVGFAASLVLEYRSTMILIAGSMLILFGLLELSGTGFNLMPRRFAGVGFQGQNWAAVYATGLVYGFSGFCAGPLLGTVLTFAATAGSPLAGGFVLLVYALGMVTPLFLMATLWDRYRLGERQWLRGKVLQVGRWQVHTFNLVAGLLFIALGLLFITTGGTVALEGLYEAIGLVDLSYRAQDWAGSVAAYIPNWTWIAALLLAGASAAWRRRPR